MTRLNTQFSVKGISLLSSGMASSSSVQFKSFCSIKSTILLEMKCPQLRKPEVTAARNQNSIGDRTEKKTLGETRLSRGAISPLALKQQRMITQPHKQHHQLHTSQFDFISVIYLQFFLRINRNLDALLKMFCLSSPLW